MLADYAACITTGAVETPPGWNSRNSTEHVLDIFNEIWREMPGARERVGIELRAAADRTLGKR